MAFMGRGGGLLGALLVWVVVAVSPVAGAERDGGTTRIVSLVPALTELAFALGAGDQVVGVSDFCEFPAEARERPRVGGLVNPGLEATLRLRPTVVLLYHSQTDFAGRLESLGVATELFKIDSIAETRRAILRLGEITGKRDRARGLEGQLARELEDIGRASVTSAPLRGVVVVSRDPAGLGGIYQATGEHFLGELFEIAGGELAVPGGAAVSREAIIRADPDVIIDLSLGDDGVTTGARREIGPWRALSTVGAVRTGRVWRWSDGRRSVPGMSIPGTAREMRRILEESRGGI